MNIKLTNLLYAGFTFILMTTLSLTYFIWSSIQDSAELAEEIEMDNVPGVLAYLHMKDKVTLLHNFVLEYLNGKESEAESFRKAVTGFDQYYKELYLLKSDSQDTIDTLNKIRSLADQYIRTIENEVFAKYSPKKELEAIFKVKELSINVNKPLEELLDKMKEEEYKDALTAKNLHESLSDDLPGVRYYLELIDEEGDMISNLNAYMVGNITAKLSFKEDIQSFHEYLELLKPLERKDVEVKVLSQIEGYYQEIIKTSDVVFTNYNPDSKNAAIEVVERLKSNVIMPLNELLESGSIEENDDVTMSVSTVNTNLKKIVMWLSINAIVIVTIGVIVAVMLTRVIHRRIYEISEKANRIAEGNLTSPEINSKIDDEIGNLAHSIDAMQTSLKQLVSSISGVASEVTTNTKQLDGISNQVTFDIQAQADKATLIASSVEEMSITVSEVASQSSDAAKSSQEAGEIASEGGKLMQDTVRGMQKIADVVNESAVTVDSLGKKGEEIGDVIKVINDIAEQTNLLALNAAIEAARAGELGRGFAVVADEVRNLAERTSQATEEVNTLITSIQSQTRIVVERMGEGTQLVSEGVELSQSAGQALEKIVDGSIQVSNMILSIATAGGEQSKATQEIAHDIAQVSQIANSSVENTQNSAKSTSNLYSKVKELEGMVEQFRL